MNIPADIAIRVSQLSKMFKIYRKPGDMFWELLSSKPRHTPFWALYDVSFAVKRGQVVGLIGRNGAGKSTLLKIITGTLDKTSGEVEVHGRISSILELGTGFNGEYTGRENVYLGGLMVGMSREEVRSKLDWIIEFSELQAFIDQPFKTYSTGMQARLTFSTAVCIDPDILIVDEALAVGDAKFQLKCFSKIDEFRRAGRTILLVSHAMNTITTFCDHAIFLEGGRIVDQGEPQRITKVYYQMLFCEDDTALVLSEPIADANPAGATTLEMQESLSDGINLATVVEQSAVSEDDISLEPKDAKEALRLAALHQLGLTKGFNQNNAHQMRMGNQKAEILDCGIWDEEGKRAFLLVSGAQYTFFLRAVFYEDVDGVVAGFLIRDVKGVDLFGTTTALLKLDVPPPRLGDIIEVTLQVTMSLTNGIYFLTFAIADPKAETNVQYDMRYDALQFEVQMRDGIFTTSLVDLYPRIALKTLTEKEIGNKAGRITNRVG